MAKEFAIASFARWHCWPKDGSVRRLGEAIRRKHLGWRDGGEYTKAQLDGYCWTDNQRVRARWESLDDDARFVCELGLSTATFVLVDVDDDPLVPAGPAQAAVLELRNAGWSLRRIGQAAEVSYDAVGRLAAGTARRRVRTSTENALVRVAASLNGQPS